MLDYRLSTDSNLSDNQRIAYQAAEGAVIDCLHLLADDLNPFLLDAQSEAYLTATKCLEQHQSGRVNNLADYTFRSAKRAILRLVQRERNQSARARAVGEAPYRMERLKRPGNDYDGPPVASAIELDPERQTLSDLEPSAPGDTRELRRRLDRACRDDRDRKIIELREKGYTLDEVGDELEIKKSAVSKRLARIAKRAGIIRRKENDKNSGNI